MHIFTCTELRFSSHLTVQLKEHSLTWYFRSSEHIIAHIRLRSGVFVFSVLHCNNTEFWLPIFVHLVPWMSLLQFFAISICLFCCDWCYMLTTFATFLIFPCQLWTKYWAHLMWFHPCLSCVMENYNLFCDFYLSTCLIPVKSCYSLAI